MDVSISAGNFKGKKLVVPDKYSDFRPTKSMVREAICSSIMMDIVDARVLELCGGSGVFALELMSRGAQSADVVELSKDRAKLIQSFSIDMKLESSVNVVESDAAEFVKSTTNKYDIIFFDPPYYTNSLADEINTSLKLLSFGGVLIFEAAKDDSYVSKLSFDPSFKVKQKKYGQTVLYYFRHKE